MRIVETAVGVANKKADLPKWAVRLLGIFIPVLREFPEMMYQFENDYIFDSTKAENALSMEATRWCWHSAGCKTKHSTT